MSYVIYRSVGEDELAYVPAKRWDVWLLDHPDQAYREVCRVETSEAAINLTVLANSGEEDNE